MRSIDKGNGRKKRLEEVKFEKHIFTSFWHFKVGYVEYYLAFPNFLQNYTQYESEFF